MSRLLPLLAALPLAACTNTFPTLSELGDARVQVVTVPADDVIDYMTFPYVTTVFIRGTNGDCTLASSDITAEIDGVALPNSYNDLGPLEGVQSPDCNLARFELRGPLATRGTSTVTIRDATSTWTITGDDMFANDFALVGTPVEGGFAKLRWSGGTIDAGADARFWTTPGNGEAPLEVAAHGNELDVSLPHGLVGDGNLVVNAAHTITPTRCDGPGSCGITLVGGATIPVTVAQAPHAKPGVEAVRD